MKATLRQPRRSAARAIVRTVTDAMSGKVGVLLLADKGRKDLWVKNVYGAKHDESKVTSGLDVFTGNINDMLAAGVVEPLKIKLQAIQSAAEAAEMILRIDDVILGGKKPDMPPQGPPGMPEMM